MAAPKKKPVTRRRKVEEREYTKLDEHSIWLNEYFKSLRRSGFSRDDALWLIATPESYPDWVQNPTLDDIRKHIDEEDED
jgi:hypothetical protein